MTPKKTYRHHDFSGQDLSNQDFSHSILTHCKFNGCDLAHTDFSHSDLTGADFTDANCRFTNFYMASMQYSIFYPKEAYGVTFTMRCDTFKHMKISKLQWYCYRFFSLIMEPEFDNGKDLRDHDRLWMGKLYLKFGALFRAKEL